MPNTDFDLDEGNLSDLEIRQSPRDDNFYYFYDTKRQTLIKSFVLSRTRRTMTICSITLILTDHKKFSPRFEFSVRDTGKRAIESVEVPVTDAETRTTKARVDLAEAHENLWKLIKYIESVVEIDVPVSEFQMVPSAESELLTVLRKVPRDLTVAALATALPDLTDREIALLSGRKAALEEFNRLLTDNTALEATRNRLGQNKKVEAVWQDFFERKEWIFGYGLRLVSSESLNDRKLETIVAGNSVIAGAGKRIDALMKTRGYINSFIFAEIKTPEASLTAKSAYRAEVFVPGKDVQGGVAQVQKTIHKVTLALNQSYLNLTDSGGDPTGEVVTVVRPRGVLVAGRLSEFESEHGTNYARFESFELYRKGLVGIEILTFDELFARAQFIVEQHREEPTS